MLKEETGVTGMWRTESTYQLGVKSVGVILVLLSRFMSRPGGFPGPLGSRLGLEWGCFCAVGIGGLIAVIFAFHD